MKPLWLWKKTNKPLPQEIVNKLTLELENTKKLFQQKTAAANKLQTKV